MLGSEYIRMRRVVLSNHIESLEKQIASLQNKDAGSYGRQLDIKGKEDIEFEIEALRKKVAALRNELRKLS